MLRILFSRLGQPHGEAIAGLSGSNILSQDTARSSSTRAPPRPSARPSRSPAGICPRWKALGSVTDFNLSRTVRTTASRSTRARLIPGYGVDGCGRIFTQSGFFDPTSRYHNFGQGQAPDLLYEEPTKIGRGHQPHEGLGPEESRSCRRNIDTMQPHVRTFRATGGRPSQPAPRVRWDRAQRRRPLVEDQGHQHRRCLCDAGVVSPTGYRGLDIGRPAPDPDCAGPSRRVRRDRPRLPQPRACVGHALSSEAQRTKMIRHLRSSLTDVAYVFRRADDPRVRIRTTSNR